jgi:hypothetical protein
MINKTTYSAFIKLELDSNACVSLFNDLKAVVTTCTNCLNVEVFCILPTQFIFHMILRAKSDLAASRTNISLLVFAVEIDSVLCEEKSEF